MKNKSSLIFVAWLCSTLISFNSLAQGEFNSSLTLEERAFFHDPNFPGQNSGRLPSILINSEYYHQFEDIDLTYNGEIFFRYDPSDNKRTHFDIRESDFTYVDGDWEFRSGVSRVFWGVTESRHLVDTINQIDNVENIDEEDRLGQPLIQSAYFQDWGTLRAYYMPYFRKRTFPGSEGRLRPPFVLQGSSAQFENGMDEWYPSFALRYEHTMGDWDFGVAQFHGVSREPLFIQSGPQWIPFYEIMDQTSVDAQFTRGAWLWKLEALFRSADSDDFFAFSAGLEYTFFDMFGSGHDLGLLAEFHFDDRDSFAPITFFDRDIFLGARYVLNNFSDTEFLGGIIQDVDDPEHALFFEFSHRISQNWTLEVESRLFQKFDSNSIFGFFNNEDFLQLSLSYYF